MSRTKQEKRSPTPAQTRASRENAALWILWGFRRTIRLFIKRLVSSDSFAALDHATLEAIYEIKIAQEKRALKRRK